MSINMPCVSVIMPVYNVEKYVNDAIRSVVEQSYVYLELLIVYDECSDNSLKICQSWAEKDSRIKIIINKTRVGLGEARNIGIRKSTGAYIFFLDSDDWLESNYIERLVEEINRNDNINAVGSSQVAVWKNEKKRIIDRIDAGIYSSSEEKDMLLLTEGNAVWGWLFDKKWLIKNELFMPKTYYYEDWGIKPLWIYSSESVSIICGYGVNYREFREGALGSETTISMTNGYEKSFEYLIKHMDSSSIFEDHKSALFLFAIRDIRYRRMFVDKKSMLIRQRLDHIYSRFLEEFWPYNDDEKECIVFGGFNTRWIAQRSMIFSNMEWYFGFSSLISGMKISKKEVLSDKSFRSSQLFQDCQGIFYESIQNITRDTILIIDCTGARYDIIQDENGNYITASEIFEEIQSDSDKQFQRVIKAGSDNYFSKWKKACNLLAGLIKKSGKIGVEIIKIRMAEKYGDYDSRIQYKHIERIRNINTIIETAEKILIKSFDENEIRYGIIDVFDNFQYTDCKSKYGIEEQYLNRFAYLESGIQLITNYFEVFK